MVAQDRDHGLQQSRCGHVIVSLQLDIEPHACASGVGQRLSECRYRGEGSIGELPVGVDLREVPARQLRDRAAAIGAAVAEGHLGWDDKASTHIEWWTSSEDDPRSAVTSV